MRPNFLRFCCALALAWAPAAWAQIPHIAKRGAASQLIVDGKPFLILGGELGNSSASNREWLGPRWDKLAAMHLNTVLAPISWELIEPVEGKFDFATLDWLIADARAHGLRLGLLWFGAWKNSMSSYAPAWVKRDSRRFPRVADGEGHAQEILSAFDANTRAADLRAFSALITHLREVDGDRHTVLLVQVENEIGMLPLAREHGAAADKAWAAGSWPSEEAFQATAYARYVEALAAAAKRIYPLPLYVNTALARPGRKPGEYPSGGPLPHLHDVWKKNAPSLDWLSPDIYFPNFQELAAGYVRPGNPLFIPEANNAGDPRAPANLFAVVGDMKAIGFSPFAIETADPVQGARLGAAYDLVTQLTPLILDAQADGRIAGFAPRVAFDGSVDAAPRSLTLGGYRFTVTFVDPWTPRDAQKLDEHGGMILQTGPDEFLIVGTGITVTVTVADTGNDRAGIELAEEGRFADGVWVPGRRLNGDQTHQGRHVRLPPDAFGIQRVRLYRYR
jgi:beta-galactosidase GanA